MAYFETSAAQNLNIKEMMEHIMDKVYDMVQQKSSEEEEIDYGKQSIQIGKQNGVKRQGDGADNRQSLGNCEC